MSITEDQAQSLTLVLVHMRPDWNPRGVLSLIKKNRDAHEFPALARAAVNAATNPDTRTPAVIFMPGSHWADPNTMTSSDRRLMKGYELMSRRQATPASPWDRKGPHDTPEDRRRFLPHNPLWDGGREHDQRMNELQADNPEIKPRPIEPRRQELEA